MLYIVSTPIGNLKDITFRAVETLKEVDLIAAEDTRHTKKLCQRYDIETPLTSYFEHNKVKKGDYLLRLLKEGQDIALVTDAGTPGISDPGYRIIHLAQENDIPMTVIPGATAFVAALTMSGLPMDQFKFFGFLPPKKQARRKKLEALKGEIGTMIFYESPYRIVKTLEDIEDVFGDLDVVCVRELTKKFEEVLRLSASELISHFSKKKPKGEFVLLLKLQEL